MEYFEPIKKNKRSMEVVSKGQDNITRKLIYSNCIYCIDREDSLIITSFDDYLEKEFSIKFVFTKLGKKNSIKVKRVNDGTGLEIELHRWEDGKFMELIWPIELKSDKGRVFLLKFATLSNKQNFTRTFVISVWGQKKESRA